jgi:hypothetical protein
MNINNSETRYTRQRKKKTTTKNTLCIGHHYTQTNTNNVNKTWYSLTVYMRNMADVLQEAGTAYSS